MRKPPIYSHAYKFAELVFNATGSFPKHLRPVLGRRLEENALDLLGQTQKVLFDKEALLLKDSLLLVDQIKLLVQLAHDLKALSHHDFGQLTEIQMQLGRIMQGLLGYREKHSRAAKKTVDGLQKFQLAMPYALFDMQSQLRAGDFSWQNYRSIIVCDPKRREILAAPFRDRIIPEALCQVIGPYLESALPKNSFACRPRMGNRRAAERLAGALRRLGPERYAVKLDVKHYFASIRHDLLYAMIIKILPDPSANALLLSLLKSHKEYQQNGRGIPIGNVSSQAYANLFLAPIDRLAAQEPDVFYIRYMDDMVLCGSNKKSVLGLQNKILTIIHDELDLKIPFYKRIPLGIGPIAFLGYLLHPDHYAVLSRNCRRFKNRLQKLRRKGVRQSSLAAIECSYRAWEIIDFAQCA